MVSEMVFHHMGDGIRLHFRQRAKISVRLGQALAGNAPSYCILFFEPHTPQIKNNTIRMDGVIFCIKKTTRLTH